MFCNHAPRRPDPPKKKRTVRHHPNITAIFKKLYRVKMYSRDTISIKEQRERGVVVTGNKRIDRAMETSMVYVSIPISDMVDHFTEGVSIFLTQASDAKEIYEAVCAHTGTWRNVMQSAMNIGQAPLEDLIAMERFVAVIYEKAKFEYLHRPKTNTAVGSLADFLYNGSGLGGMSYDSSDKLITGYVEHTKQSLKTHKHEPDINIFRDALMQSVGGNSVREF